MKTRQLLLMALAGAALSGCPRSSNNNNGDWITRSSFAGQDRIGAVAFTLNNLGYIATGFDGRNYYNDLWVFDPIRNTWTQLDTFPGEGRALGVAFATDNFGYIGFGGNGNIHSWRIFSNSIQPVTSGTPFPGQK